MPKIAFISNLSQYSNSYLSVINGLVSPIKLSVDTFWDLEKIWMDKAMILPLAFELW